MKFWHSLAPTSSIERRAMRVGAAFTVAISSVLVATLPAVAATADGAAPTAKICGEQWKQAKAAGTLPAGQTWPQYLKACRGATPSAAAGEAAPAVAALAPGEGQPSAGKEALDAGTDGNAVISTAKLCGQKWKQAKAAGSVPSGQTWPQYLKLCSGTSATTQPAANDGAAAGSSATATIPAKPVAESAKAAATSDAKPASQAALVAKACGVKWRAAKAAGTVAADVKWNAYLQTCRAEFAGSGAPATQTGDAAADAKPAVTKDIDPASKATTIAAADATQPSASSANGAGAPAAVQAQANPTKADQGKAAAPAKDGATTAGSAPVAKQSPKQVAALAALNGRRKTCGAAWQEAKAAKTLSADQTWPKFWSSCNTKLKAQGG